jgi:hypothetical protein
MAARFEDFVTAQDSRWIDIGVGCRALHQGSGSERSANTSNNNSSLSLRVRPLALRDGNPT